MQLLKGVLDAARCQHWLSVVRAALAQQAGPGQAWSNGLRLNTLPDLLAEVGEVLETHAEVGAALRQPPGPPLRRLDEQCWARHQRPPQRRAPGQTAHSWHQDGALGFDFLRHPPPYGPSAMRRMLTCWLPLVDCGEGRSPSLAWFEPPWPELLPPASLSDDHIGAVMARLAPGARVQQAAMQVGDALLFGGGTVHRTHATPDMPHDRISLELRWATD